MWASLEQKKRERRDGKWINFELTTLRPHLTCRLVESAMERKKKSLKGLKKRDLKSIFITFFCFSYGMFIEWKIWRTVNNKDGGKKVENGNIGNNIINNLPKHFRKIENFLNLKLKFLQTRQWPTEHEKWEENSMKHHHNLLSLIPRDMLDGKTWWNSNL